MRFYLLTFSILMIFTFVSCDNNSKVKESKSGNREESKFIEKQKTEYLQSIDSLNKNISKLASKKQVLQKNLEYAQAQIYSILKKAYLDHVIIGTKNLNESKLFFKDVLGFEIKNGTPHKNGISNFFIEFRDTSEIEFIEVSQPKDNLSNDYLKMISNNKFGMQFAFRITELDKLEESFAQLKSPFIHVANNGSYSTLSSNTINKELPVFFIQYNAPNMNSETHHSNKEKRIKSVWFETKDIKNTARQLVDFGFEPFGKYSIPSYKNKIVEFRNNNFGIILIEAEDYQLSGITISISHIGSIINVLEKNNIEFIKNSVNNIFLNPEATNSIWIEFTTK